MHTTDPRTAAVWLGPIIFSYASISNAMQSSRTSGNHIHLERKLLQTPLVISIVKAWDGDFQERSP